MDLHEFDVVAEHYDSYVETLSFSSTAESRKRFIDFHLALAESQGQDGILDIACGTGRVAIPLAQAGYTLFAFDTSDAMIHRFNSKVRELARSLQCRINTSVQNMIDFIYPRSFNLAMIPASGFMHLVRPEDQRRALVNINRHLEKKGVLTFNTFDPNLDYITSHTGKAPKFEKRTEFIAADGHVIEMHDTMSYDPEHQTMEGVWRFITHDKGGAISKQVDCPLRMRYTFRQEMYHLLELTGFTVDELYGSYGRDDPEYPSSLVWIARKVKDVQASPE